MVVVCHPEVSTVVPRNHNLVAVPVTRCLDVALKTSLTSGTTTAVKQSGS